jgi:hypothetical protein
MACSAFKSLQSEKTDTPVAGAQNPEPTVESLLLNL